MDKRGQIALFLVIIAIVALVAGIYFYMGQGEQEEEDNEPVEVETELETDQVRNLVNDCLTSTAKEGILYVGNTGGYYRTNLPVVPYDLYEVVFYRYEDEYTIPSLETISTEISNYVRTNIPACLNALNRLENQEIEAGEFEVDTTIAEDKVNLALNLPLTLKRENTEKRLGEFDTEVDFDLREKYTAVESIMDSQKRDNQTIPISDITYLASVYDFEYDLIQVADETFVFNLEFDDKINAENFTYNYAMNYRWEE
ncbi:MAG: hypothetical protein ACQEP1_04650 [Nanobdellota archaeon]